MLLRLVFSQIAFFLINLWETPLGLSDQRAMKEQRLHNPKSCIKDWIEMCFNKRKQSDSLCLLLAQVL